MQQPAGFPSWMLIGLPIGLLVFDILFKSYIFKHPPYDSIADITLAALTFNVVHLFGRLSVDGATGSLGWAIALTILQPFIWFATLAAAAYLQQRPALTFRLALSYAAGVFWFVFSAQLTVKFMP